MEHFSPYVDEPFARRRAGRRNLPIYLGLAVLVAAASLVAVNARDGGRVARPIVPKAGSTCTTPPNGFLWTKTVDGVTLRVCISQEGNINQIEYPTAGRNQLAWDGYCIGDLDSHAIYTDYSPGSGIAPNAWGPATLTQTAPEILSMTRDTSDGRYRLTEFIKINFQPRSVFVGMTVKNIDPANVTHTIFGQRGVAPAIDGSAADDQYNEFGAGHPNGFNSGQFGRTGMAFQSPGPGNNSLVFGPTQSNAWVITVPVAQYQARVPLFCSTEFDPPGLVTGGNRVLAGGLMDPVSKGFQLLTLAPNQSASLGKFVYRMV